MSGFRPRPRALPPGIVSAGRQIIAEGSFLLTSLERKVHEAVDADDRDWLERHPDREQRIRPMLPGEIPAGAAREFGWDPRIVDEGEAWFVTVIRGPFGGPLRDYGLYPLPVPDDVQIDPIEWPS
jgi:hypothetical protein